MDALCLPAPGKGAQRNDDDNANRSMALIFLWLITSKRLLTAEGSVSSSYGHFDACYA